MKKSIVTIILVMIAALSLVACGGTQDTSEDSQNSNDDSNSMSNVSGRTPSECFLGQTDGIWYLPQKPSVAKDTEIRCIFVVSNGMAQVYDYSVMRNRRGAEIEYHTLGELSKMTDEQIISMLEDEYKLYIEARQEELRQDIMRLEQYIACEGEFACETPMDEETIVQAKKCIEEMKKYQFDTVNKAGKCEVAIYTDSTGNNTDTQQLTIPYRVQRSTYVQDLYFSYEFNDEGDWEMLWEGTAFPTEFVLKEAEEEIKNYTLQIVGIEYGDPYEIALTQYQVYDSYYSGFATKDSIFYTRVEHGSPEFYLDEVGAEGVVVDP